VWQALDLAFHASELRSTSNVQKEITKPADQLAPMPVNKRLAFMTGGS
jgi:hypothetical protein